MERLALLLTACVLAVYGCGGAAGGCESGIRCGATDASGVEAGRDASADADAATPGPDAGDSSYEPNCERRLAARPPDPRVGTAAVVLDPMFTGGAREAFCAGSGGLLVDVGPLGTRLTGNACRGRLAREAFRYGLCSCGDITASMYLDGRAATTATAATVAANGRVSSPRARVSELVAGGCQGIAVPGALDVTGNAWSNGVISAATTEVGRDLWTGTGVSGAAHVRRDAYLVRGATVTGTLTVDGMRREFPVDIPAPCVCDGSFADDIHAAVLALSAAPDQVHDTAASTTFTCGRHLWRAATFSMSSRIEGRVAIAVAGDMATSGGARIEVTAGSSLVLFVDGSLRHTGGSLTVVLGAGATFDAFIVGDLTVEGGAAAFGDRTRPGASHWYVAGQQLSVAGGSVSIVGGFYAPNAAFTTAGFVSIAGSLVAESVAIGAATVVHDPAVSDIGTCTTPGTPCGTCADCPGNDACVRGVCGACATDADCCGGLYCIDGACVTP